MRLLPTIHKRIDLLPGKALSHSAENTTLHTGWRSHVGAAVVGTIWRWQDIHERTIVLDPRYEWQEADQNAHPKPAPLFPARPSSE
jgi:hypothetical protein